MKYEEPLDDEQRAAVEATERAIAVLAGPGSGKTRVLSYRARHLLMREKNSNCLLLTFTNKAASEMKSRAIGATPVMSKRIRAGTFTTLASPFFALTARTSVSILISMSSTRMNREQ